MNLITSSPHPVKVKECILPEGTQLSIQKDLLWTGRAVQINDFALEDGITELMCINLSTQESHNLSLNKVTCFNRNWVYYISTAFSKDSIFIPRFNQIDIFDIQSGNYIKTMENVGKILSVRYAEEFLYALCCHTDGNDQLLRYDIQDLSSSPKQLILPGRVAGNRIHFGKDVLLIEVDTYKEGERNKLYAIPQEDCFSDKVPEFSEYSISEENFFHYKINQTEEGFYMMVKNPDSPDDSTLVQKLNITKTEITASKITLLPLPITDICDFCITPDYLYTSNSSEIAASRYSIEDGTFVDQFKPAESYDLSLSSHFLNPEPGIIQLLSGAYQSDGTKKGGKSVIDLMTLEAL